MEQELEKIERTYDILAKEWAETFSDEHNKKPKDQEILHRFSQEIGVRTPIWDFGCGPGNTTKYLKDLGVEISGLDLSEKILIQAKTNHPAIHFQKGNILKLDFNNDSIAAIVAFYAIVHFTEKQVGIAFREIFRVLQPGGIFLFTYHIGQKTIHLNEFLGKKVNLDFMFFTTEFISNCLKNNGFKMIDIIEREPYAEVEYQKSKGLCVCQKTKLALLALIELLFFCNHIPSHLLTT